MKRQTEEEIKENIANKLVWDMACRNDKEVAGAIYRGKEIDGVHGMEDTGILDGFYEYLEDKGIIKLLKEIKVEAIERVMVPFFQFVLLYFLKTLFGAESIASTPRLLFSNEGAMKLVGFNAQQIEEGICSRGEHCRKVEKTGPICDDTLSKNIVKIPVIVIEKFFNETIKKLAKLGIFPKEIRVILDPTDIQTTRKWKGCGSVTRKKRIVNKKSEVKEIEVTVFGWKLIAIFWAELKIPLAVKLVKINEHGSKYTRELIKKAEENLAGESKIVEVVMDREQLDGEDLWWLEEEGLRFIVPSKSNMDVTADARALAEAEVSENSKNVQSRIKKVRHGNGNNSWVEKQRTTVVAIEGLTTYDQYGPEGFSKDKTKKNFEGKKINAVVVIEWEGRKIDKEDWVVYLTNNEVKDAFKIFDGYDERSIIENSLFKEAKQGWHIKHAPVKTEEGLTVHIFFTLVVFALTNTYRKWKEEEEKKAYEEDSLGILRWRETIKKGNRDKSIIFVGGSYGIFWTAEILVLSGVKVKDLPKGIESREEIFKRYGLEPK